MVENESNEYPKIVVTAGGFIAKPSKSVNLPGIFLTHLQAERALAQYTARSNEAKNGRKKLDNG